LGMIDICLYSSLKRKGSIDLNFKQDAQQFHETTVICWWIHAMACFVYPCNLTSNPPVESQFN